jgi:probable HAF family extracellular repeat protein
VIAERSSFDAPLIFTELAPLRGRGRELQRLDTRDSDYVWDLSPDGTRIAVLECLTGKIEVISPSNQQRVTINMESISTSCFLDWAPDGERKDESPRYKLIDLGTFGGPASYYSEAGIGSRVLNNRGDVAGYADTSIPDPSAPNCFNLDCFVSHAFRWHNGVRTDLGAFPGVNGSAVSAINGRGWIVGFSEYGPIDPLTGSPHAAAALWRDGQMISLGTLEGGADSNAIGVNDRGQIIGFASNLIPDPLDPFGLPTQLRTFLWENGVMRDIGTLGGPDALPATGINNRGQVTGSSYVNFVPNPSTGVPTADPFLWEDGNMIDLGSFGGTNGGGLAVSNRGQVMGQSNLAGDVETHAFLWNHGILTHSKTLGKGPFQLQFGSTRLERSWAVQLSKETRSTRHFFGRTA